MNEIDIKKTIVKCWNKNSDRVITKKDVYIAILNREGAVLSIDGVSGYITYSNSKGFTTSIKQLADLVNMRVGENK